jgi:hypothetical protein
LEGEPLRKEAIAALGTFIEALLKSPEATWQPWAISLSAEVVDRGGYVIREPLFRNVLFPALLLGLNRNEPGCARWLGGMAQHLYRCPSCMQQLGPERATEWALFRLALDNDPSDAEARRRLIKVMASQFAYSLHELPAGVLFGSNGATLSQCDELTSDLSEFERLTATEGCSAAHAALIEKCRFHFSAYKEYLMNCPKYASYAAFLAQAS